MIFQANAGLSRRILAKADAKSCLAKSTTVKIENFLTELKRRNVYKVAVGICNGGECGD